MIVISPGCKFGGFFLITDFYDFTDLLVIGNKICAIVGISLISVQVSIP